MSYRDDVLKILEKKDFDDAAVAIYNGSQNLAMYVILLGLNTLKAKHRRERRRELVAEIQPEYQSAKAGGQPTFTIAARNRFVKIARDLYGPDGYMIGNVNIGNMTKEQLLAQAENEKQSARGSLRNAKIYEAIADPLKPGQKTKEYWKPDLSGKW